MKKAAAFLLLSLMVVSCDGNGNGDATGPSEVFQGTFRLESITGTQEGITATVTPPAATGTLVVRPDNTYTISINWPEAGLINETSSGTWTREGNTITATDADGSVIVATLSDDQNTVTFGVVEEGLTGTITYARA